MNEEDEMTWEFMTISRMSSMSQAHSLWQYVADHLNLPKDAFSYSQ